MEHKLNKLLTFSLSIWIFFTLIIYSQDNSKSILPLNIFNENLNLIRNDVRSDSLDIISSYSGELFLQSVLPGERGFGNMLMFDSNHNNIKELVYSGTGFLYFIEISGNEYEIVHTIEGFYNPIAVGDIDNDRLADLVVQQGNFVLVFESKDYLSFPDSVVWNHTLDGPYGTGNVQQHGKITDLDKDGNKEILITSNQFTMLDHGAISVFEVISDNNYKRNIYFTFHHEGSGLGNLVVDDFNNNGKVDIACTAGIGDSLYIFEIVSNDSIQLQFKTFTGLTNQYWIAGGKDLDGDYKKEIFVSGDSFNPSGTRTINIYEPLILDHFEGEYEMCASINQYTGVNGIEPIATGNIHSADNDELVLQANSTYIFNSNGDNNFILIETLNANLGSFVYCYDIIPGGYDELQILGGSRVYIFKNRSKLDKTNTNGVILSEYSLSQNYPNPFNPNTTIKYQILEMSFVTLKVYDVLGKEVANLVNEEKSIGNYELEFNGNKLASGVYFYQLRVDSFIETKKMLLLK
jgi:hypothetical protein